MIKNMNRDEEHGFLKGIVITIVVIVVLSMLSGCGINEDVTCTTENKNIQTWDNGNIKTFEEIEVENIEVENIEVEEIEIN